MTDTTYLKDLGDGLILRRATHADAEDLADFDARVHSEEGWETLDLHVGAWVRDLASRPHPTFDVGDFLVVEDTANATPSGRGAVASTTNLIPQTWSYAGIEFGVGRPELVGTHPDYRRRGLVRAQFEVLHQWSAERGHKVQAITGIPWYYRQFGYEMAPDMHGGRRGPVSNVPALKEGQEEPFSIRPATVADLDFIADVVAYGDERSLLSCVRDSALWRYELDGKTEENMSAQCLRIIEAQTGDAVGFLAHPNVRWGKSLCVTAYELRSGISWWAVAPSVLRYLKQAGDALPPYSSAPEGGPAFNSIALHLGPTHPTYDVVENRLPELLHPYAWYIRVPDVPDFLRTIAPVLEARLAESIMVGYTGTLKLDFYSDGIRVVFEDGHIVDLAPWPPEKESDSDRISGGAFVRFPNLIFLQVLFGYRSLDELMHAYADCGGNLEGRLLAKALFPKQSSTIWPVY